MTSEKSSILYVDDEENNLISFKAAFRREYNIFTAISAKEGIRLLKEHKIHLVITDQRMPEMTGVEFLEAIIPDNPDTVRIILTGFSDVQAIIKAINTGRVYRYITKPWDENELRMTIEAAINLYKLQERNKQLLLDLQEKVREQEKTLHVFKRYVPEAVVLQALSEKGDSLTVGESRVVSVFFSDIRNYTQMASEMKARNVVAFLNAYYSYMSDYVIQRNGYVNQYVGDGIFATFGAPISYQDDQINAVLCALDIVEGLANFNLTFKEKFGYELAIGIGINTGEVVAGNLGSKDKIEYSITGDTVNVGARIEALTKDIPNCILISESTYKVAKNFINVIEWEPQEVKGKKEKLKVYQVIGRKC